jgi:hypothetical protein
MRPAAQVRNNIVVALTDMTVQYTALVDGHVPKLAACLADPHELVRRQALALLASLLSRVRQTKPSNPIQTQSKPKAPTCCPGCAKLASKPNTKAQIPLEPVAQSAKSHSSLFWQPLHAAVSSTAPSLPLHLPCMRGRSAF